MRKVNAYVKTNYGVNLLLGMIIGVFILQRICEVVFEYFLAKDFAFSLIGFKSYKFWQIISYAFLHESFFHILCNSILLLCVGKYIEAEYGSRRLWKLFLFSAIVSVACWSCVHIDHPYFRLIGASGGALGLFSYFCLSCNNRTISVLLFFIIPVRARPKVILLGAIIFEIFYCLTQELYGAKIASSAHIGGMLGGIIYFYGQRLVEKLKNSQSVANQSHANYKIYISSNKNELEEIDRILNKINKSGFGSLTDEEKETLNSSKCSLYR